MDNRQLANLGCGCSVVAGLFALFAALPLLGWTNWFTALPAALLAIVFSGLSLLNTRPYPTVAILGLIGGVAILFWTFFRLALGGGVV